MVAAPAATDTGACVGMHVADRAVQAAGIPETAVDESSDSDILMEAFRFAEHAGYQSPWQHIATQDVAQAAGSACNVFSETIDTALRSGAHAVAPRNLGESCDHEPLFNEAVHNADRATSRATVVCPASQVVQVAPLHE